MRSFLRFLRICGTARRDAEDAPQGMERLTPSRQSGARRDPASVFRRSIAWRSGSLSTLRRAGYPASTQDSLPAVGQTLLDGLSTRKVPTEGFRVLVSSHPPSPSLLGASRVALAITRQGSHRSVRARIRAYGSSTSRFATRKGPEAIRSSYGDMTWNLDGFRMVPSIESAG